MKLPQWISAPFAQPAPKTASVPTPANAPVMIVMPVATGYDDSAVIFASSLRRGLGDGADLAAILPRLVAHHPEVGRMVIEMGNLGRESWGRAVETLRVYRNTGVAMPPQAL